MPNTTRATGRTDAVAWAQQLLDQNIVILDFETTGFKNSEIVQIGAINRDGDVLLETLVKPTKRIPSAATNVHGITNDAVKDAPGFREVYVQLSSLLAGSPVVAYNVSFEKMIIGGECDRYKLPQIRPSQWECAMIAYAGYYGQRNPSKGGFKWQKLGNACAQQNIPVVDAHTAVGDCIMTLELMKIMARG